MHPMEMLYSWSPICLHWRAVQYVLNASDIGRYPHIDAIMKPLGSIMLLTEGA